MSTMNSADAKKILSANLKAALEHDGLTYWEFAKRVDVTDQTISNLCRGEHEPKISVLTELAGALGLNFPDMLASPDDFSRALGRRDRKRRIEEWKASRELVGAGS